jgi:cell wall-associated NlpC family hydrolase
MTFDRRVTPFREDLADERLRGQVAAERFSPGLPRRVVTAVAPLRRRPFADAPLDTEALLGERVTVYDEQDGWAWGQLAADGYVGYLPSAALGEPGPEPTHRVAELRTFRYPEPDLKRPPVDWLSLGAAVTVVDQVGDYARLAQGGFVFRGHVRDLAATEPDFAGTAERFLHVPYLWGGKTSLGLDCSALVQVALAAAGIPAARDSDLQERALGDPIEVGPDLGGLARGDLVFWRGHVGIMLDPERLLHANGHTMTVAVEPLRLAEARIRRNDAGPITSIRRIRGSDVRRR